MKKFFYYLGWTVSIGIIIYLGSKYQLSLEKEADETFNVVSVVLFSSIFSIITGILLRFPKLINEIKQKKKWGFDWIKFSAIGLPSLLILLIYLFIIYLPVSILQFIPQVLYLGNSSIQIIAGVVFGYILLDSLKK